MQFHTSSSRNYFMFTYHVHWYNNQSLEKIAQDYSRIAPTCQSPASTWIIAKSLGRRGEGELDHSWRSSQVHNHKSPLTITCATQSLRRSHSSTSSSLGNVPLIFRADVRTRDERREIRASEAGERKWNKPSDSRQSRGAPPCSRASVLERVRKWGRRGEHTSHRSTRHCLHSPDDPAREASCRPIRCPRTPRAQCACAMILLGLCSGRD